MHRPRPSTLGFLFYHHVNQPWFLSPVLLSVGFLSLLLTHFVRLTIDSADKSGKKFAPKAPARRAPPGPRPAPVAAPPAPQGRPDAGQPIPTPQPEPPVADTAAATHEPPAPATELSVPTVAPTETPVVEPLPSKTDSSQSETATAICIPRPKRKASISAPPPKPNELTSTPSQPTPPPHTTSTTEPPSAPPSVPPVSEEPDNRTDSHNRIEEPQGLGRRDGSAPPPDSRRSRPSEGATEIRPTKRRKTTPEVPVVEEPDQSAAAQVITPPATQTEVSEVEETTRAPHATSSRAAADHAPNPTKPRKTRAKKDDAESTNRPRKTRKPRGRKQREPTPEGAENIEITPTVVTMSDLCKDLRTGKMSKRETELRNMELVELERKRKAEEGGEENEQMPIKQNGDAPPPAPEGMDNAEAQMQSGPVMRIVNGEIVLDNASLQVDRHADAERNAGVLEDVVENSLTRKINQSTYGKRTKAESWDEEMTDLFYRGLRMFGTDFMMISKLFPNRSRHQIKLKFNNEERRHPERIKETLLGPSETIDIATYSEMTNAVYDDPKAVQQELDDDKRRIEDQHAKEKEAQEELLRNPGGTDATTAGPAADASVKGKPRNNRKQTSKNLGGGTEEVVGSIDDFPQF